LRAVLSAFGALIAITAAGALAACGDPFGGLDANLRTDSVTLASVTSPIDIPTAIDIVSQNATAEPELPTEAGDWDFQVRPGTGGGFVLHPNPGIAPYRSAGLQLTTRSFDDPGAAPRSSDAYTRTDVAVTPGQTYYLQSRQRNTICGTTPKYGILKVLSVSADSGIVHLAVKSNQNCDDERLGT